MPKKGTKNSKSKEKGYQEIAGGDQPENPPAAGVLHRDAPPEVAVPASAGVAVGGSTSSAHAAAGDPLPESPVHRQYHEPGGSEGFRVSPRRDAGVDYLAKQFEVVAKGREKLAEEMELIQKDRRPLLRKADLNEKEKELLGRLEKEMAELREEKKRLDEEKKRLDEERMLLLQRAQAPAPPPPEGTPMRPIHEQSANPAFFRLPGTHAHVLAPHLVAAYHATATCFAVLHNFVPAGEEEVRRDPGLATLDRRPVETPTRRSHYSASLAGTCEGQPLVDRYNAMIRKNGWVPSSDVCSEEDVGIIDINGGNVFEASGMDIIFCGSNQDYKFECHIQTETGNRTRINGIPDCIVTLRPEHAQEQLSKPSAKELCGKRCVFIEVASGGKKPEAGLVQLQVTMEAFLGSPYPNANIDLMYGIFVCGDRRVVHLLAFRDGVWYEDGQLPASKITEYCKEMLTRRITAPPASPFPRTAGPSSQLPPPFL